MKVFEGTDLPDDFFAQVKRYIKSRHDDGLNATADAVLALLGRPLNHQERMAIVEALHAGRLNDAVRSADSEASSAGTK